MFYGYQQMRQIAMQKYSFGYRPELDHPRSIADTISLDKFHRVRMDNEFEAGHGYSYSTLGNNAMVDRWVAHGIDADLLTGFWRLELDALVRLDRSTANQRLMQWLRDDQMWFCQIKLSSF